jgi:hypothetical protein
MTVVAAFAETARPVILRYFNRSSCIASSRIALEVLRYFGIDARAIPVRFALQVPSLKIAFVSGLTSEQKLKARATAGTFIELEPGPEIRNVGGGSWNGHVIVHAGGCLLDPSFDQALDAIAQGGAQIDASPRVAVFALDGEPVPDYFEARFTAWLDDETEIYVEYASIEDDSFKRAPAWETDHLQPAIEEIISSMEKLLERAA